MSSAQMMPRCCWSYCSAVTMRPLTWDGCWCSVTSLRAWLWLVTPKELKLSDLGTQITAPSLTKLPLPSFVKQLEISVASSTVSKNALALIDMNCVILALGRKTDFIMTKPFRVFKRPNVVYRCLIPRWLCSRITQTTSHFMLNFCAQFSTALVWGRPSVTMSSTNSWAWAKKVSLLRDLSYSTLHPPDCHLHQCLDK